MVLFSLDEVNHDRPITARGHCFPYLPLQARTMKTTVKGMFACLLMLSVALSQAEMELLAPDGKRVLLKDDMTWQYIEQADAPGSQDRYAHLSVAFVDEKAASCRIGLRMRNGLADGIDSIVLRFSAFTKDDILYETVSKGFHSLKPTNNQHQEISFRGIPCSDIKGIRVHGGDRCSIGELNKFSDAPGQCLGKVAIEASDKISIYKRYSDKVSPPPSSAGGADDSAK
jgi:hypothetical protein